MDLQLAFRSLLSLLLYRSTKKNERPLAKAPPKTVQSKSVSAKSNRPIKSPQTKEATILPATSPPTQPPALTQQPATVLMFIDGTNIFESAKKYSAKVNGFLERVPDMNCRLYMNKMMLKVLDGRRLLRNCMLYTSEEKFKTIDFGQNIRVKYCDRSTYTNKEKEVDTRLTADAVEAIIQEKDKAPDRTLILLSGDTDLYPLVRKAKNHGYKVEIWSFEEALSEKMKRKESQYEDQIRIRKMEDIFEDISYSVYDYYTGTGTDIKFDSLVATYEIPRRPNQHDRRKFFEHLVKEARRNFLLPMLGKELPDVNGYGQILLVTFANPPYLDKCKNCKPTVATGFINHFQTILNSSNGNFRILNIDVFIDLYHGNLDEALICKPSHNYNKNVSTCNRLPVLVKVNLVEENKNKRKRKKKSTISETEVVSKELSLSEEEKEEELQDKIYMDTNCNNNIAKEDKNGNDCNPNPKGRMLDSVVAFHFRFVILFFFAYLFSTFF